VAHRRHPLRKKPESDPYEKLAASSQILRHGWIIFGEFLVSFVFIPIRALG
jgi:hypothetical protein